MTSAPPPGGGPTHKQQATSFKPQAASLTGRKLYAIWDIIGVNYYVKKRSKENNWRTVGAVEDAGICAHTVSYAQLPLPPTPYV